MRLRAFIVCRLQTSIETDITKNSCKGAISKAALLRGTLDCQIRKHLRPVCNRNFTSVVPQYHSGGSGMI